jgi:hypothetical protein
VITSPAIGIGAVPQDAFGRGEKVDDSAPLEKTVALLRARTGEWHPWQGMFRSHIDLVTDRACRIRHRARHPRRRRWARSALMLAHSRATGSPSLSLDRAKVEHIGEMLPSVVGSVVRGWEAERLETAARGLLGVEHQTSNGWQAQPRWLTGLLRIGEIVADGPVDAKRRAVIITPHPSQLVALLAAHLSLRRFETARLPEQWWDHEPTPKAAVRWRSDKVELLLFRQATRRQSGRVTLRFGTSDGLRLDVSTDDAADFVPIPYEVLPDPERARLLDLDKRVFDSVHDFLGMACVPYALGNDASVTVVGRREDTRRQLEENSVRGPHSGVATLAALARVKEFAHAASYRSRWLSPDSAASGDADEGSILIVNGGTAVGAVVHDLEGHNWIAVLDRSSPSLIEAVHQVEQYYYSVATDRLNLPGDVELGRGHEVLLFEEPE